MIDFNAWCLSDAKFLFLGQQDANQNQSSLKKAYNDRKMAKLILSIWYFINGDLPVYGFDPTTFNYEFNWVAETHFLEHNVRATEEQNFVLDGIPINIKKGTKFHLLSSYKYPVDYFLSSGYKRRIKTHRLFYWWKSTHGYSCFRS